MYMFQEIIEPSLPTGFVQVYGKRDLPRNLSSCVSWQIIDSVIPVVQVTDIVEIHFCVSFVCFNRLPIFNFLFFSSCVSRNWHAWIYSHSHDLTDWWRRESRHPFTHAHVDSFETALWDQFALQCFNANHRAATGHDSRLEQFAGSNVDDHPNWTTCSAYRIRILIKMPLPLA